MRRDDYARLGGHVERVVPIGEAIARAQARLVDWNDTNPWPVEPAVSR
jgi:hypothetical protein